MQRRFPDWLTKRYPATQKIEETAELLEKLGLNTVCQSAGCPNLGECYAKKTATFLILGDVCTRSCKFCAVKKGKPTIVDQQEPIRVAEAVAQLGLKHVVITSVTRDDLIDGGAAHFAATIKSIRSKAQDITVEVLTPDLLGNYTAISIIVNEHPNIFNHNVETVPRLYPIVRPKATFERSLGLLQHVKQLAPSIFTKSGLMVGLGESPEEVLEVMAKLRTVNCDILTIGQYLQPSAKHLEVSEFVPPEQFGWYKEQGEKLGFLHVSSDPFVRSSYYARELLNSIS